MARLFVAIDLPPTVRDQLRALSVPLTGARWANADQTHLTLRFIGETEAGLETRIRDALATINASGGELLLSGLGCFPPRRTPRVLWVGVRPDPWLMKLQSAVETVTAGCGIAAEAQSFTPHITLARLQRPEVTQVRRYLDTHRSFAVPAFAVREFTLYSSLLQPRGAVHTKAVEYRLLTAGG